MVTCYHDTLSTIFNLHAPVTEKEVALRPNTPWYNEHIRQAKQKRRQAERKFRKTKSEIDKEILKENQKLVNDLSTKAKQTYYNSKITDAENNSKHYSKSQNSYYANQTEIFFPVIRQTQNLQTNFHTTSMIRLLKLDWISKTMLAIIKMIPLAQTNTNTNTHLQYTNIEIIHQYHRRKTIQNYSIWQFQILFT